MILTFTSSQSLPIFAQTIVPPYHPPPARTQTVPGSIIVQFKENPDFTYEQRQEITVPLLGTKIETRKEGFASRKFSSVTKITKDVKIEQVKKVYENLPNALQADKMYTLKTESALTEQTIEKLKNDPNVIFAQPNYIYHTSFIPNDPYFSQTPLSHYQWNLARINAPLAWDITKGNPNVKVAIIDTGAALEDYTEGGLQYRKAPELTNTQVAAKYRHVSITCTGTLYCDCQDLPTPIIDNHALDKNRHGTHVTETIFQAMNNNNHATGIAPNASLIAIRASSEGSNGGCFDDRDLLAALEFAKNNGAHVVSMSLGGSSFDTAQNQKIQELINQGITIIAAAGNAGSRASSPAIDFPGGYPNVIAVGATRWDNVRAFYSSYGAPSGGHNVTLVAPGGQWFTDGRDAVLDQNGDKLPDAITQQTIIEEQPNTFTQIDETVNPYYGAKCVSEGNLMESCGLLMGTSQATPHVAAAVALMKSVNINLTPNQIQQILTQTANYSVIPGYDSNEYGAGLLDVYAAVVAAGGNPNQTYKGWNKLQNVTVSTTTCPIWSQKITRWIPSRLNFLSNTISNSYPNFYKCN